jgi:hypothetical protein
MPLRSAPDSVCAYLGGSACADPCRCDQGAKAGMCVTIAGGSCR